MAKINFKNNKDFQSFRGSRTRLTFEQAVQNSNLKDALEVFDDISISYVFRYNYDFFIVEAVNNQGDTRWIMPGEIRQLHCESLELAEEALFEEFHEYIVEKVERTMDLPTTDNLRQSVNANGMLEKDWIVNYKWIFIVSFIDAKGIFQGKHPLTSFGPDYATAKVFLLVRMKNKKQKVQVILSAKAVAVHFACYQDFTDVPKEKYKYIPLPTARGHV